jgi:quinol monooxygenase YgiN
MVTKALLVRLEAHPGKGDAVEDFLVWARLHVEKEPGTQPWSAARFDASTFGIVDAFPDDEARQTHLAGPVGQELKEKAELFASPPQMASTTALATTDPPSASVTRCWPPPDSSRVISRDTMIRAPNLPACRSVDNAGISG